MRIYEFVLHAGTNNRLLIPMVGTNTHLCNTLHCYRQQQGDSDSIKISINHLTLDPSTTLWDDDTVERLFVEYDLLGDVEETPEAVDIPIMKNEKLVFNYKTGIFYLHRW